MKAIKFLQICLFAFCILLVSCEKAEVSSSAYSGDWSGNYTGADDSGTWSIVIDEHGKVDGIAHSTKYEEDYNISGSISNDGEINFVAGTATSGASFTGNASSTTAAGNWVNTSVTPTYTGTWSGAKN